MSRVLALTCLLVAACGQTDAKSSSGAGTDSDPQNMVIPCDGDGDCETGFCDLGACAKPQVIQGYGAEVGYGAVCDDEYVPDNSGIPIPALQPCISYVCKEDRCRSCETAEDCGDEPGDYCMASGELPGQRCGWDPNAAAGAGGNGG